MTVVHVVQLVHATRGTKTLLAAVQVTQQSTQLHLVDLASAQSTSWYTSLEAGNSSLSFC